ncbi:hypothetical protein GCM10008941_21280 [Rhizomicrobium palustre]
MPGSLQFGGIEKDEDAAGKSDMVRTLPYRLSCRNKVKLGIATPRPCFGAMRLALHFDLAAASLQTNREPRAFGAFLREVAPRSLE